MNGLPEGSKLIGFLIDGEVADIIGTPARLGEILLNNPTIVDLTNSPDVHVGCKRNNGKFDCAPPTEEEIKSRSVRPWDMLNKENYVEEETAKSRLNICNGCEHLIKLTKTCKKCGCFMTAKTKLKNATCPVGKW